MREEEDEGSETCIHNSEALEYGFEIPTLIRNSFMVYLWVLKRGMQSAYFWPSYTCGLFCSLWLSVCKYDL